MKGLIDWLDHRTGVRKLSHEALFENIPGGSRWRYVWGSTLTFTLLVQIVTGLALWAAYNPSSQTAWESVFSIQNTLWGGWILRGIHHYTAQAMNVLLVLHLMQVLIDGAYKAPREVNFWFGLILLLLVLGLSLTGYLLPWDQKGFWATKVATNIAGITPLIGPYVQKIIVGGSDYGHHTLSRFFALHAGVLPGLIIALVIGHIYLFRRHGITAKEPFRRKDAAFWPDQVLKDAVACLAVLAAVMFLTLRNHGAELGPPADPSDSFSAARPEWYFLFLFQFLKYFPGGTEAIGAILIPGLILAVIFLMPVFGRWKLGHRFNLGFMVALLAGAGLLTWQAVQEDKGKPEITAAIRDTKIAAERIKELAEAPSGIPSTGAITLLRKDPLTQGPKLFAKNCASCHRYGESDGTGRVMLEPQTASDLKGFASRAWLTDFLTPEKFISLHQFGGTKFKEGRMSKFVAKNLSNLSPEKKVALEKVVIALSAEAGLRSQSQLDATAGNEIKAGVVAFKDTFNCAECHQFYSKDEDATAPDLTGYGSREWLTALIRNPKHDRFYGAKNDRMPSFGDENILDDETIHLLTDWLRGEWYERVNEGRKN